MRIDDRSLRKRKAGSSERIGRGRRHKHESRPPRIQFEREQHTTIAREMLLLLVYVRCMEELV